MCRQNGENVAPTIIACIHGTGVTIKLSFLGYQFYITYKRDAEYADLTELLKENVDCGKM